MTASSTIPLSVPASNGRADRPLGVVYLAEDAWVPCHGADGEPVRFPDAAGELRQCYLDRVTGRIALKQGLLSITEPSDWLPGVAEILLAPQSWLRVEIIG